MESTEGQAGAQEETRPGCIVEMLRALLVTTREILLTVVPAILVAVFINTYVAQAMVVEGPSMTPTLHYPQRVIVDQFLYRYVRDPERGEVIVVNLPGQAEPLIKRVVALPGETIEVVDGQVFIDGELLEETWLTRSGGPNLDEQLVPQSHVFVMGDNRGNSRDSRAFGPVHVDQIVGRARFIYWPLEDMGLVR